MSLYQQALKIYRDWYQDANAGSLKLPEVLTRQISVSRLKGFCLYGFAAAVFLLFRHDYNPEHIELIEQLLGWIEWPLDFAESSNWPTLWRIVPMHLENYRARGNTSWSESLQQWGDDEWLMPAPTVAGVEEALKAWLGEHGLPLWQ